MLNIKFNMPVIEIRKELNDCVVCNIQKTKFELPFRGNYDDCLITCQFSSNPDGTYHVGAWKIRNTLNPIRTFRVFNQKSQFLVFVNENYDLRNPTLAKLYRACNGHFIQIFENKYHISRRMIFVIRNAAYYTFLLMNNHQIGRIFTYDFGDTIFLEDPFGFIGTDGLYFSTEGQGLKNGWGNNVIKLYQKIYGGTCDLKSYKLVNGGTVAGYHTYVLQFFTMFFEYMDGRPAYEDDQVYFNMIQYCVPDKGFKVTLLNSSMGYFQYYGHPAFKEFPPNVTYPICLMHFYNRPDITNYYKFVEVGCVNFSRKITYK